MKTEKLPKNDFKLNVKFSQLCISTNRQNQFNLFLLSKVLKSLITWETRFKDINNKFVDQSIEKSTNFIIC